MTFKKTVENFVCEHCQHQNIGNGFTDHCERCLWSKHVDVDPGDRTESCGGGMEPIGVKLENRVWRIKNKCNVCGFERWAPVLPNDDFEKVLDIA